MLNMLDRLMQKMLEIRHQAKSKKNILVVGPNGMLGQEVVKLFSELSKDHRSGIGNVQTVVHSAVDFSSKAQTEWYFSGPRSCLPDVVINCAGFTDTAAIQSDNDKYDEAYRANVLLPKFLAAACACRGIKFVHVSTDYVMSEFSSQSYLDPVEFPVSIYGLQKLVAENFVREEFSARKSKNYLIARTSWLYGKNGKSKTFPEKIAKLLVKKAIDGMLSEEKQHLDVDVDTQGYPTSTTFLAKFIANAIRLGLTGTVDAFQPIKSEKLNLKDASMSRTAFADKVFDILQQKIPHLKDYVSVRATSTPAVHGKFTMRHPKSLPDKIATGNGHCLKKYIECLISSTPSFCTLYAFVDDFWKNMENDIKSHVPPEIYSRLMEIDM